MNADYSEEFLNAIDAAYSLYPSIREYIEGISVNFEMQHGLGQLDIKEREFMFWFNSSLMSLETVHHEVAHMVCYCLDLPMDHGNDFITIKESISEFCANDDRSCFIHD